MKFLGIGLFVACCIPLLSRGSYARLLATRWRWFVLLAGGALLQASVDRFPGATGNHRGVAIGLFVASYVLLLGFCYGNLIVRGMAVVAIGIAANFVAIAVNQGMPIAAPPDWRAAGFANQTVKHHTETSADSLHSLSDIIVVRNLNEALSFGDLIIIVGMCDVTFHASRRRKRTRGTPAITKAASIAAGAEVPGDVTTLPNIVEQLELAELSRRYGANAPQPEAVGID